MLDQLSLDINGLTVNYGAFVALRGVTLTVGRGEIVVLLGANGAGKSTLFRTISGLQKPTSGSITYGRTNLVGLSPEGIIRMGIAQCPEGRLLFPELSVEKNLVLGGYIHRRDKGGVKDGLEEVYALFPILRDKRHQAAGSMSGGQQQMLAIGRALMARPKVLLLDEPSLGLAPLVVEQVLEVVQRINAAGTSVLLAEQNAYAALSIAHRGYVLENGVLTLEGTQQALLGNDAVRSAYIGV
ncbi:ABC transporter ATP-binding protein [Deinococcus yavapaiensis]|uniref:Amino acid/amide ABC transporter ATP-binding protein 2 (HAAT family) n=1 Tax=Deinococcus yavapaiensis KR-236 TaxID=694435 RepID=A0A318SAE2_9DEIO|nr:ABC transporter ATP-binding protein [Deinococcus yavapaiensis]PYE54140.1 amino acid/amide ABC transporter ATP-binding protein 2 (HAAT family) [Deinococcus yavapaiensis KR-236]